MDMKIKPDSRGLDPAMTVYLDCSDFSRANPFAVLRCFSMKLTASEALSAAEILDFYRVGK